jgi:hypothetical protein
VSGPVADGCSFALGAIHLQISSLSLFISLSISLFSRDAGAVVILSERAARAKDLLL